MTHTRFVPTPERLARRLSRGSASVCADTYDHLGQSFSHSVHRLREHHSRQRSWNRVERFSESYGSDWDYLVPEAAIRNIDSALPDE
ncbi:MAG: hypothetical protein EOO27_32060 [Comamonadaceae bacterium]|jgi:hypothetical protein|nr:MAG: hypothetical protein EOO27_32060 [Comamonadaceae bacterium]